MAGSEVHPGSDAASRPADGGTREAILASAATLFAERGYQATRIRDIAKAIDVSKATVYHYFRSKDELLFALSKQQIESHLASATAAIEANQNPVDAIVAFIGAHLSTLLAKRTSISFALLDARLLPPEQLHEITALRDRYAEMMRSLIAAAQEDGLVRTDFTSRQLQIALSNLLNGTLLSHRTQWDVDAHAGLIADLYLHGLGRPGADAVAATAEPLPEFAVPDDVRRELEHYLAHGNKTIRGVAVTSFRRLGYLGTTTREMARSSGLGNATLYHHVSGKEELLLLICLQAVTEQADRVLSAVGALDSASERLARFLSAHVDALLAHPERAAVAITEERHLSGLGAEQVRDLNERYRRAFEAVVGEAQAADAVRPEFDPHTIAPVILGALNWSVLWYDPNRAWDPSAIGGLLADVLLTGVARA